MTFAHNLLGILASLGKVALYLGLVSCLVLAEVLACTEHIYTCKDTPCCRLRHATWQIAQFCCCWKVVSCLVHLLADKVVYLCSWCACYLQSFYCLCRRGLERHITPALYKVEVVECAQEACLCSKQLVLCLAQTWYLRQILQHSVGAVDTVVECVPQASYVRVTGCSVVTNHTCIRWSTPRTAICFKIVATCKVEVLVAIECWLC